MGSGVLSFLCSCQDPDHTQLHMPPAVKPGDVFPRTRAEGGGWQWRVYGGEAALPRDTCSYKKLLPPPADQVRAADVSTLPRSPGGEGKQHTPPLRGGAERGVAWAGQPGRGGHLGSALGSPSLKPASHTTPYPLGGG